MTPTFHRDPASFRDPSGYVFSDGTRILRSVGPAARAEYEAASACGLLQAAGERGLLIASEPVAPGSVALDAVGARGEAAQYLLEHPRLPLVTYPYEWTFSQLQDSALAHLDLQLLALEHGFELSDATAYNMQFAERGPLHIDVLSLRRYREGAPWQGYNQFCRQFLFPLLLESERGIAFQQVLRGSMAGIELSFMQAVLPAWRRWTRLNLLMHVQLQAAAVRKASSSDLGGQALRLPDVPRARYRAMLEGLRDWIAGLRSGRPQTYWSEYAAINSYADEENQRKQAFVTETVRGWGSVSVMDVGGNAGDYSACALAGGARHAWCVDSDVDALELAYRKRKERGLSLLPLVMSWSDPSPGQGWGGRERRPLHERARPGAVLALAVVHHIVIGGNVPMAAFVDELFRFAPRVLVEFVPRSDAMVQGLLRGRDDIFGDYTEENFAELLRARGRIESVCRLREGGRVLFACVAEGA